MARWKALAVVLAAGLLAAAAASPTVVPISEATLRTYDGAYRWSDTGGFIYLQPWNEFTGKNDLVSFDEAGEIRTLYPTGRDRFFTGTAAAVPDKLEAQVEVKRTATGGVEGLTWMRQGQPPRTAQRVETERREAVSFPNGLVRLEGTLIAPVGGGRRPAVILVHGSGPESRDYMLPFARFLVRRGMTVLTYDKRGVGGSTGDWNTASFEDLASDVVAAFDYLKTRADIDPTQVGMMGISQAGWIMPLAAVRAPDFAFLISISGAGVPVAETTIDQTRNEMMAARVPAETIDQIVQLMELKYAYAKTGQGWDAYLTARAAMAARAGRAPPDFPGTPDDPYWASLRRIYFYDPAPTLAKLTVPVLGMFGELDPNIVAGKNRNAWETALKAGGAKDYTLVVLPKGDHLQLQARSGTIAEMASLQRFVPSYASTVESWLSARVRGFRASGVQADN